MRTKSLKVLGDVSMSICRTKRVPNSGIPKVPTGVPICSSRRPRLSREENRDMVFSSSKGISKTDTPVISCRKRSMVGSSWPRISNFTRLSSRAWYSKWVVMVPLRLSFAGCWMGVKSKMSLSGGTTTIPPGCCPVVRLAPASLLTKRFTSALRLVSLVCSRYFMTKP